MASASETAVQLRESLRSGTLTLRDLDNKRKARSRSKRRRNKKEEKGAASDPRNAGIAVQANVQAMRNSSRRYMYSSNPTRGLEPKKTGDDQNSQDHEKMVRSLLDAIIEEAYGQCAAIEYSVTRDHVEGLVVGLMSAYTESTSLSIAKCKAFQEEARQIQELMLKAAEETLDDLFVIAAHGGFPIPAENCCDAPIYPQLREFEDPPRKVAPQAMLDVGEEAVENPFTQADSDYRLDNLKKQSVESKELLVDEDENPLGGCRRYICCISPPKSKQKKEKTGFISRLRNVFKR